jgi:RNA polymerase sigma-70 factor (ECF subfamily)
MNRQRVLIALRGLSTEHRQVVVECCLRVSSVSRAATTLDIAPSVIKSRIHYALHALRRTIDDS